MCELLTDYTKPSCRSVGGVTKMIVYNLENRDSLTVTNNEVTVITMASGKRAYLLDLESELSQATQTATSTRTSTFFAQEVLAVLTEQTQDTVDLNALLSKGFFGVIVFYESGLVRHFGLYKGMIANIAETSGTAMADGSMGNITFSCNETVTAPTIDAATAEALLIAAS